MLGSDLLDVAIGVIFVFFLTSILCSAIREGIEALLKTRATHLEEGIRELLHDPNAAGLAKQLFQHPLVAGLYAGKYQPPRFSWWWPTAMTSGRNLPSYIPSRNFALALMDMAARGPAIDAVSSHPSSGAITFESVRANIAGIGSPPVQRALLTAIDSAQGDLQKAQANLEAWFDSSMDRVSGWYKRSTQWFLFAIGLAAAVAMNINIITIADYLYREKPARDALVSRAQTAAADATLATATYKQVRTELEATRLPIGQPKPDMPQSVELKDLVGWLITALGVSLGAPFWFDLLNKFMVIRSTVKPHEKSPEEASEDRQTSLATAQTAAAPPPVPAAAPAPVVAAGPVAPPVPPSDPDHVDGCDVDILDVTHDEDLPAAQGGVA
jgi:hypothetical protein